MFSVGIFLFGDIELLDFAGPLEVYSVTGQLSEDTFHAFTVTQDGKAIRSVNGLTVVPDYSFTNHPQINVLVIPGGVGTKAEMGKQAVLDWIMKTHKDAKITMSVCSGARLLGKLGLLDGRECTTHHEVAEHLGEIAPSAIINIDKRFVGDGRLYTSAGISAGIDLSLHIVEKLFGSDVMHKTVAYMEYGDWKRE